MTTLERKSLAAAVLIVGALLLYVAANFRLTTDITQFLPDAEQNEIVELSRELADSELSRTMILAVEANGPDAAVSASLALEAALRADPVINHAVAFIEAGPSADLEQSVFALYEPRRLSFIADDARAASLRLSDPGLERTAQDLRQELEGPLSSMASRLAPQDPFLSIPSMFRRLERSRSNDLNVVDGRFLSGDENTAVLFMATRFSAMDSQAQAPVLESVQAAFDEVAAKSDESLRLYQSGLNRFSTWAARAIEADIKRVSISSAALVCGILLLLFRSLRFIALASIPVSVGVLAGCAAVLAVFGRLHGITLAFGASLIGVSVDYVFHLYCHHAVVAPDGGATSSLHAIKRPLITGALTTTAGFAALSASSLLGLREVACFAVAGILAAFMATVFLVPSIMPGASESVAARDWLTQRIEGAFSLLDRWRRAIVLVPTAAMIFVALVLPGARWNSDLASLNHMDAGLLEEDGHVQALVTRFDQMQFVVAIGPDEEAALRVNDQIAGELRESIAAGELGSQQSLSALLPSARTQREVRESATGDPSLPDRLSRIFGEQGFSEGAFLPFIESLNSPWPEPLTYGDLLESPLASLVRSFRVQLSDRVGFITYLQGIEDTAALEARVAAIPGAVFMQQSSMFNNAQREYQRSTLELLAWGLGAVLCLLALRYREPARTLVTFIPSVLAAGVTVSVVTLTGRGLDLISLTALLFVVSMGVDYSVFLVDARDESNSKDFVAALTGTLLACISTVGAFSLLALSDHPVLSNLGLTGAVGVATSLLLAPTLLVFVRAKHEQGEST